MAVSTVPTRAEGGRELMRVLAGWMGLKSSLGGDRRKVKVERMVRSERGDVAELGGHGEQTYVAS